MTETPSTNNNCVMNTICYDSVFSIDECQKIIAIPKDNALITSWQQRLLKWVPHYQSIASYQFNLIAYHPTYQWVFDKLSHVIQHVNQTYHRFALAHLAGTQVQTYQPEDFQKWHSDLAGGEFSLRKLGIIVCLSPRSAYEGGELQFRGGEYSFLDQNQGSVIVFPAYTLFQVTPVQAGQLSLLCSWAVGARPFV